MNNADLIARAKAATFSPGNGCLIRELADALEAEQPGEDVKQIIYALERQIAALDIQAETRARARDYSAEFPAEDARHLRAAIARLTHPAPQAPMTAGDVALPPMYGAELFCGDENTYSYCRGKLSKGHGGTPLYTAAQLQDYGDRRAAAAALAERERCANIFLNSTGLTTISIVDAIRKGAT